MLLRLWKHAVGKLQCTANGNTHTHMVYITYMSTNPPGPHTASATFTASDTWAQIYTNLLRPSNTFDPEPRLTAKTGWVMNQGKDQRRARDRWAKASTARWCLFIVKDSKGLAWQEPCRKRSEWSFYQMIVIVFFFWKWEQNQMYSMLLVELACTSAKCAYGFPHWKSIMKLDSDEWFRS